MYRKNSARGSSQIYPALTRDRLNSQLLAGLGDIDGVLEENNWVIVGEGHRPASALHRRIGNGQHQLGRPPRLTGTAAVGKPFGLNS